MLTAHEYKESLPKYNGATHWKAVPKAFCIYINLLHKHISFAEEESFKGWSEKIACHCTRHDQFFMGAPRTLMKETFKGCPSCVSEHLSAFQKGETKKKRVSAEDKIKMREMRALGISYSHIARDLGYDAKTVMRWCSDDEHMKQKQRVKKYRSNNKEALSEKQRTYYQENKELYKEKSAANYQKNKGDYISRARSREAGVALELSTLSTTERREVRRIYQEAALISTLTGVEHHVDHIIPLSRGGLHIPENLQVIEASENLSKGDKIRDTDWSLWTQRVSFLFASEAV